MSVPHDLDLVAVILAGGTGTRLWPVSQSDKPKQFHKFFGERTLLQTTYDRLSTWVKPERVLVLTQKRFVNQVKKDLPMLPEENIVGEPVHRDTAAALTYAGVLARKRFGNPTMIILPSDHLITPIKDFRDTVLAAAQAAHTHQAVYTLGVKPDRPDAGLGYLHCGKALGKENGIEHFELKGFREKPDIAKAQEYISSGEYYWNCGIFVLPAQVLLNEVERHLPEHFATFAPLGQGEFTPEEFEKAFQRVKAISIDYGVMEKSKNLRMVPAYFVWSDLGNWPSIEKFLIRDLHGNSARGDLIVEKSANNFVFCENESERVLLLGVKDMVVVRSGKDTLIVPRAVLPDLKALIEKRFK